MTLSGFSAGGNLALSVSHLPECQPTEPTSVKGLLLVYGAVSSIYFVGLNPILCLCPKMR
jgi:hypothetical protein